MARLGLPRLPRAGSEREPPLEEAGLVVFFGLLLVVVVVVESLWLVEEELLEAGCVGVAWKNRKKSCKAGCCDGKCKEKL